MDPNVERENMVKGIKRLIALILIAITLLMMVMLQSCSTRAFMTKDRGVVIDMGEQWVEVMYQVVNKPSRSKVINIYYKEHGHRYQIGDTYPDLAKESYYD